MFAMKKSCPNPQRRLFLGSALVVAGALALLKELGYITVNIPWTPLLLIGLGVALLYKWMSNSPEGF